MRPLLLLSALLLSTPALAQDTETSISLDAEGPPKGFGLGIVVGEPTGLTLAVRPNSNNAVQAHASWSFIRDRVRFNVDYLQTFATARAEGVDLPFYVGIGGLLGISEDPDNVWAGARVPVGLAVHPSSIPVEPFLEVAPGLLVVPESDFIVEGSLGVRYYF